jgi:hypothetical protein
MTMDPHKSGSHIEIRGKTPNIYHFPYSPFQIFFLIVFLFEVLSSIPFLLFPIPIEIYE